MYSLNLPDDLKEAAEIERRGLRNIIKKTIRFSKKQRCLLTPIRKKTNEDVEKRNKSEDGLPVLETMDTQNDSDVPQREIDGKLVGALIKDSDESFDTFNRFSAWMVDETKRWSYRDADNCHWEVSIRLQSPEASYNDLAPVELDEAPEHSIRLNSCEPTGMATVANIKQLTKRRMPYDGGEINTDPSTKKWTRGLDCGATCVNHHGVSSTSDFERIYFDEDEKTRSGRSATLTILSRKPDVARKPAPSGNHQTKRVNCPFTFRMADKRRTRIMIPNRHWAEELAHDEFHMANGNFIHLMVAELFALQEVQQCSANFEVPPVLGVTPRSPEEVVPTKWKSNETVLNLIDRAIVVGSEQLSQTKMQTSSQQLSASLFTGSMESEYEDTNDPVDVSEQAISPCEVIEAEERIVPVVCVPNKESRHCGDNSDSDVTRASQTSALLIAHALKKRVHTQIQSSQTVTLGDSDKTPKSKPMHQGKDIHKLLAYFALSRSTKTNSINSVWLPRCISEILRCQEVGQLPISLTKTLLPLIYMLSVHPSMQCSELVDAVELCAQAHQSLLPEQGVVEKETFPNMATQKEYDQVHTSMQCRELVDAVKLCAQAHQSLLPEQGVVEKETFPNMATQEPQKPCSSDRIWLPRCFSEMLQPQEVKQLQKSLNEIIHSVGSTHEMHPIQLCEEIVDVAKSCAQGRHTSLTECGLIDNEITPSILNQEMSRSSDRIWLPRCFSEMLQPQEVEQLQKSLNEIIHSVGSTHEVHSNQQCKELLDTGNLCAQAHHSSMAEQELNGEKKSPSIVTQELQKPCSSDRIWLPRCFSEMLQPQEVEQLQKSLNEIIHSVGSTHEVHSNQQCKELLDTGNLCAQAHHSSMAEQELNGEKKSPSIVTQEVQKPCSSDRIWLPRCFSEMLQPQEVEQLQKSLNEIIHSVGSTHEESHQMHPCHQCKGLAELMNLCAQAHRLSSTDHGLRSEEACPSVLTQEINRDQRIKRLSDAVEQCIHSRLSVAEKNTISEQRPSNANPVELSAEDRAESEVNIVMSPEISMTSEQRQKWNGGDALNLPHTPEMNQTKYLFEPHELTLCRTASLEAQKGSVAPECKSPLWFPQYIDHSVGDFTNKDTDTYRYLEKNLTAEETRYIDSSRVFTPLCSPQVDFMRPLFELRELSLNKSTLFNPEFNKSSEQLLPTSSIFQHIDSAMDVEADDNLRCPRRSEHQSTVTGSMSFMDLPQDHYAHCEMDTHSLCNPQQSASESLVDRLESTGSLEIQKNQSPTLLMPSLYVTAADKPSKPFKRLISSPEGDLILREPRRRSHSTLLIRTQKEEQVAIRSTKLIWEEYKKRFPSSPRKQSLSLWILNFEEPVFQQEVLNEPKPKPRPMSVDAYKYAVSVTKNHQNRQNVQEINPVTIDMTKSPNSKVLFEPSSYVTYDSTTASSSQLHESVSVPESEFSTPIPNAPTLDLRSASDFSAYKSIPMGLVLVRTEPNLKKTVLIDRLYRLTRQTGKQCDVRIITFSDCGLHVVCLSAGNKNVQEIQSQSVSDTYGVPSDQGTNRTKLAVSTTLVPEP